MMKLVVLVGCVVCVLEDSANDRNKSCSSRFPLVHAHRHTHTLSIKPRSKFCFSVFFHHKPRGPDEDEEGIRFSGVFGALIFNTQKNTHQRQHGMSKLSHFTHDLSFSPKGINLFFPLVCKFTNDHFRWAFHVFFARGGIDSLFPHNQPQQLHPFPKRGCVNTTISATSRCVFRSSSRSYTDSPPGRA